MLHGHIIKMIILTQWALGQPGFLVSGKFLGDAGITDLQIHFEKQGSELVYPSTWSTAPLLVCS
jgi:hypothetical protein